MDLFEAGLAERLKARGPLASPTNLGEVVGQDHLLGPRADHAYWKRQEQPAPRSGL